MSHSINELFSLKGKVALITGGAGWLGSLMSEALAEAGAKVAIVDYNAEAVEKVTTKFNEAGLDTVPVVADIMQEDSIRQCVDKVAEDCGRLDILINCALLGAPVEINKATIEDYEKGYRNSSAYAICAQQAVKHMRKLGGGSIINIGSMYGMVTSYPEVYEGFCAPNSMTYSSDKAAVIHMTHYMAVYWAKDKIRVNSISPGAFTNTSKMMYTAQPGIEDYLKRLDSKIPLGRSGEPWELKGAIVFLASNASSFVTGHNLVVDGGWTVW